MIEIFCSNCNRLLAECLVLSDPNCQIKVCKIQCPYCQDTSFSKEINGRCSISAGQGLELIELNHQQDLDDPNVINLYVKLERSRE